MSDQLLNIANSFEPKIRSALLRAFAQIKSEVNLDALEIAIRTQGITGANYILSNLQIEGIIGKEIVDDLNAAVLESGRMTISVIPAAAITERVFHYNILNPTTADYIRNYQFNLIRTISSNTREAIRNSVEANFIAGNNPYQTAKAFQNTVGLTPKQELAVRNYQGYLEQLDSNALKRQLRDPRFDVTVNNAIRTQQKLSVNQIDGMVNAYRKRYINYRARTIARTESLRAVSIGEYTSGVQAVSDGAIDGDIVKRFWIYTDDKRTRNQHRQIPGLNFEGVAVDQPFVTPFGPLLFPRDPRGTAANTINCRCHVIYKIID